MTIRSALVALLCSTLAAGCGGKDEKGKGSGGGMVISGTVPATAAARSGTAFSVSEVKTVVAFSSDSGWWSAPVSNGAFDLQVDPGVPIGLVFAGADDQFLGYLALPSGFLSIPLQAAAQGVSTIDLGTLAASGAAAISPGHDPVGTELLLGASEKAGLLQAEGFFSAAVLNPDADGDGKIDVLQGRFFRPFVLYFVRGGRIIGTAGVPNHPADIAGYRFGLSVNKEGGSFPASVTFTGPTGSGLAGAASDQAPNLSGGSAVFGSPYVQSPVIPPGGTYTVGYQGDSLAFDIPDQLAATEEVAVAVPALTLNGDGTIQKLSWTYQLGGGSARIDPRSLIHDLIVQIDGDGSGQACAANGGVQPSQGNRVYNSPNFSPDVTEHVLACQNISAAHVSAIYMAYNDLYGNHMVVSWDR